MFGRSKSSLESRHVSPDKKRDTLRRGERNTKFGLLDDAPPSPRTSPRVATLRRLDSLESSTLSRSAQSTTTASYSMTPLELQHLLEFGTLLDTHSGSAQANNTHHSPLRSSLLNPYAISNVSPVKAKLSRRWPEKTKPCSPLHPSSASPLRRTSWRTEPKDVQGERGRKGTPFQPMADRLPPRTNPYEPPPTPMTEPRAETPGRRPPSRSSSRDSMESSLVRQRPSHDGSRRAPSRSHSHDSMESSPVRPKRRPSHDGSRRPPSRAPSHDSMESNNPSPVRRPSHDGVPQRRPPSRTYSHESMESSPVRPKRRPSHDDLPQRRPPPRSHSHESMESNVSPVRQPKDGARRPPPSRSHESMESNGSPVRQRPNDGAQRRPPPPSRSHSHESMESFSRAPPVRRPSESSRRPPPRAPSHESTDSSVRSPVRQRRPSHDGSQRPPSRSHSHERMESFSRAPEPSPLRQPHGSRRPSRSHDSMDSSVRSDSVPGRPSQAQERSHERDPRPRAGSDDSFAKNTSQSRHSRPPAQQKRPVRSVDGDEQSVVSGVSRRSFRLFSPSNVGPKPEAQPDRETVSQRRAGRRPPPVTARPAPPLPTKSWTSTFFKPAAPTPPVLAPVLPSIQPPHTTVAAPQPVAAVGAPPPQPVAATPKPASPKKTFIKPPQPTTRKIVRPAAPQKPKPPPPAPAHRRLSNATSASASQPVQPKKRHVQPAQLPEPVEEPEEPEPVPTRANPYLTLVHQGDSWNGMVTKPEMKCPERATGQLDQFRFHNYTLPDEPDSDDDSSVEKERLGRIRAASNDADSHYSGPNAGQFSDESSQDSDPVDDNDGASIVVTDDDEPIEVQRKIARMTSGQLRQWDGFRHQVTDLVSQAMPDHLPQVDDLMSQFAGREAELVQTLQTMVSRLAATPKGTTIVHRSRGIIQCGETSARRTSTIVGRKIDAIASIAAASTLDDQMQTVKAEYIMDEPKQPASARRGQHTEDDNSYDDDDYSGSYSDDYSGSYSDDRDDDYDDEYDDEDYDDENSRQEDHNDEYDEQYHDGDGDRSQSREYDDEDDDRRHENDDNDRSYNDEDDDRSYNDEDDDRSYNDEDDDRSYSDEVDDRSYNDDEDSYSEDDGTVDKMHNAYHQSIRQSAPPRPSVPPRPSSRGVGRKPSKDWSFGGQSQQSHSTKSSVPWR